MIVMGIWILCAFLSILIIMVSEGQLTVGDLVGCILLAPLVFVVATVYFIADGMKSEKVLWRKKDE